MNGHGLVVASRDARVDELLARLGTLADEDALIEASAAVRDLAFELMEADESPARLTRTIADLNDALSIRLIELAARRFRLDGLRYAWLALGSEGRREQTVHTDQDNALIFDADDPEAARARLLPFAQDVNRQLDRCGFDLCRGGVMAGNPRWCLSTTEWRGCFAEWIDHGDPQALLHGTIFFDFRGLCGELAMASELRDWLSAYIGPRPMFLRQMSQNTLRGHPPLDWRGHLKFERQSGGGRSFDIKLQGAGLFTDAARILALGRGVDAQNTAARLLAWARTDHERREAASWVEAFHAVQGYRLRRQRDAHRAGEVLDNRIRAESLTDFDQRVLTACFEELRQLRRRIAVDYGLAF